MSNINWIATPQEAGLNEVYQQSFNLPVLIYKHSTRCSISSMVLSRLERSWNIEEIPAVETYFLDLIANRETSHQIANSYGVYHESPQILILVEGECIFHTSHMGISFSAIKSALNGVSAKN